MEDGQIVRSDFFVVVEEGEAARDVAVSVPIADGSMDGFLLDLAALIG